MKNEATPRPRTAHELKAEERRRYDELFAECGVFWAFSAEQFERHVGETVKLQLRLPIEGRRRFQGRIEHVDINEQRIVLDVDEGELILAHDSIEKARIVPDLVALGLAPQPKPGKRNNN